MDFLTHTQWGVAREVTKFPLGLEKEVFSGLLCVQFVFLINHERRFHSASVLIKYFRRFSPQICVLKFCENL